MFSAVLEEGPGMGRMKLINAFGRWVRSLRRSKPKGMVVVLHVVVAVGRVRVIDRIKDHARCGNQGTRVLGVAIRKHC